MQSADEGAGGKTPALTAGGYKQSDKSPTRLNRKFAELEKIEGCNAIKREGEERKRDLLNAKTGLQHCCSTRTIL